MLHVFLTVQRKGKTEVTEGDRKKKSLKDERNAKRKATAGRDFNWSILYMNVRQAFVALLSISPSRHNTHRVLSDCGASCQLVSNYSNSSLVASCHGPFHCCKVLHVAFVRIIICIGDGFRYFYISWRNICLTSTSREPLHVFTCCKKKALV